MKKEDKSFWYTIAAVVFLFILTSALLYRKIIVTEDKFALQLQELQKSYDAKVQKLTDTLNSDMTALQNLISNLDKQNKKKVDDLTILISKVESESKQSIEEAKNEIANIGTSGGDFSKVIQDSLNGVVSVITNRAQGSGAIIDSDGIVVTNYHVIEGARTINVLTYDKVIYKAGVVGYDVNFDVAVLKIQSNETFSSLDFGNSDIVKIGQNVVALGNPYGLDFTATQGIISARRTGSNGVEYVQIDVPINPGNSGGPVIDASGEIIGIANFKISSAEGIGFAIPSNTVEEVVNEII